VPITLNRIRNALTHLKVIPLCQLKGVPESPVPIQYQVPSLSENFQSNQYQHHVQ
jgi:hypothetical protein